MSNTDSTLLISIFQKANPLLEGQSTSEYLDYFGYPISETVGTFVRLGLAEHDLILPGYLDQSSTHPLSCS